MLKINSNKQKNLTIHPKYLFNTIVHIYKVGKTVPNRNPLNHLCIGTDFDGLINPIDNCISANEMKLLRVELVKMFREYRAEFDIEGDIDVMVDGIMFRNAHRFLEKHFN